MPSPMMIDPREKEQTRIPMEIDQKFKSQHAISKGVYRTSVHVFLEKSHTKTQTRTRAKVDHVMLEGTSIAFERKYVKQNVLLTRWDQKTCSDAYIHRCFHHESPLFLGLLDNLDGYGPVKCQYKTIAPMPVLMLGYKGLKQLLKLCIEHPDIAHQYHIRLTDVIRIFFSAGTDGLRPKKSIPMQEAMRRAKLILQGSTDFHTRMSYFDSDKSFFEALRRLCETLGCQGIISPMKYFDYFEQRKQQRSSVQGWLHEEMIVYDCKSLWPMWLPDAKKK